MKTSPQRSVVPPQIVIATAAVTFATVAFVSSIAASCATAADPPKLTNAAQTRFGARVSVITTKDGSRDPQTSPDATFDGNTRTRCILLSLIHI